MDGSNARIHPDMTVLDVVSRFRRTEAVFKAYDRLAGECICCRALFSSLKEVASTYDLDLEQLLADLKTVAESQVAG